MKTISSLLYKDLKDFITSKYGIGTLILFIISSYAFLWVLPSTSYVTYGYASADLYFQFVSYVLLFIIPLIAIGALSKEYRYGTIELMRSRGITWQQLVIAKVSFTMLIALLIVVLSVSHLWAVDYLALNKGLDLAQLRASFIGILLVAAVYTVVAVAVTSWLEQATISILLSILISFIIHSGFAYLADLSVLSYQSSTVVNSFSLAHHIDMLGRGVLRLSTLIYISSLVVVGIGLSIISLRSKDW